MENNALERAGAASGLGFVVLSLLSAFIYPQQPSTAGPASTTLAWVHQHRVALQAGMIVALFAAATFVWFAGCVRLLLQRAGGRGEVLAPAAFGAGIAVAVFSAVAALPTALLAFMDSQPAGIPDATVIRMLGDLNTVSFAATSVMTAAFLLAFGMATLHGEVVGSLLGRLSVVVAVVNGVAVWVEVTFSSYHGKGWNAVGWGAFIGFLVLVAATSVALARRQRAGRHQVAAVAV